MTNGPLSGIDVSGGGFAEVAAVDAPGAQANAKMVQRMLGHASAAMTLDVHADLFESDESPPGRSCDRPLSSPGLAVAGPFKFSVKDGRPLVSGCWDVFPDVKRHSGFAELASMLDLDETGTARRVPVAGLDPDEVWQRQQRSAQSVMA